MEIAEPVETNGAGVVVKLKDELDTVDASFVPVSLKKYVTPGESPKSDAETETAEPELTDVVVVGTIVDVGEKFEVGL